MQGRKGMMPGPGLLAALALAVSLAGPGIASLRGQTEVPLPALLEQEFLLSVGEIVDPARWRDAETVLGTAGGEIVAEHSLTVFDLLYVPAVVEGRALAPGDRIQLFRLDRPIEDPETGEWLGDLLVPTGVARVEDIEGEVARVRVTDAFHEILVGDRVRFVDGLEGGGSGATAVAGSGGGRIVAFQEEKAIHPTFDKLFLRPEVAGALAAGQVVELFRPGRVRDGTRLPDRVLGKAMVVRSHGPLAEAVTFELEGAELEPGDLYRAAPSDPAP